MGVCGVEVAGGFVGEEEGGAVDEGAGDRGALELAAAELVGEVGGAVSDANETEELVGPGTHGAAGGTLEEERKLDVFDDGHRREEVEKLENDPEMVAPVVSQSGFVRGVEGEVTHVDLAGVGVVEPTEEIEEGALPTAAGAGDGDELAVGDGGADVVQCADLGGAGAVGAGEMGEGDQGG